jgi:hypothetical protein
MGLTYRSKSFPTKAALQLLHNAMSGLNARGLPSGRPVEKLDRAKDYIMPALVPLPAGLLEANSCMVSRMYLCGLTGVSWMRTS